MKRNELMIQGLLSQGYVKVGSKSHCEYWKKGENVYTVYHDLPINDHVRDKRLMMFTSLLRTLDFVSHARVDQCHSLFLKFEEEYPLLDGYTRTGKNIDHNNMKMFIQSLNTNGD